MGKKNKNKFKKQIKAQLIQEMSQVQKVAESNRMVTQTITPNTATTTAIISPVALGEINLPQIKYDLKKTLIVVLILAIFIGALYFLDLKYGILLHFGSWLFKALNINKN